MSKIIPQEIIEKRIYFLRNQKVMLSTDLAELYSVEPKVLVQAVKRNKERFPEDFMFQLTKEEFLVQRSQIVTFEKGKGRYPKYWPYAFTEQGVAMLSCVLRSKNAVQVNIEIMRTFVRLRQMISSNANLARKLKVLEKKYDEQFKVVFEAIYSLMETADTKKKKQIGFNR